MGHSDGGSIALIHAGGAPATRVRGLVLEAPHVFCEDLVLPGCGHSPHREKPDVALLAMAEFVRDEV